MSKTMDEKLQEQIEAPDKRSAKVAAEAKEVLDQFMARADEKIERHKEKDRVSKIIAGILGVIIFCLCVYSLGIYIATTSG